MGFFDRFKKKKLSTEEQRELLKYRKDQRKMIKLKKKKERMTQLKEKIKKQEQSKAMSLGEKIQKGFNNMAKSNEEWRKRQAKKEKANKKKSVRKMKTSVKDNTPDWIKNF